MKVDIVDGAFEVEANLLAPVLGVPAAEIPDLLRAGEVTSVFERGEGEDAGTYRLTFFYRGCRARLIVDESGQVRRRSSVDFGEHLPRSPRRAKDLD